MIRQLTGTVAHITDTSIVVDVGDVGYLVALAHPHSLNLDESVSLWTHLAVRETALDLYGFLTLDELEIFELLITLPKIGPKSAMTIMHQADIVLLKQAVANDDAGYLAKMSGIGKKTAEKIVMELKDKFELIGGSEHTASTTSTGHHSDTIDALISLGYPERDARQAVKNLPPEIENTNDALREALRVLSK